MTFVPADLSLIMVFLSMEIGSAYALQVCLLQIPAMVAFSTWWDPMRIGLNWDTFTYVPFHLRSNSKFTQPQSHFPSLGRHLDRLVYIPTHLHIHRSTEQLSQRKHSNPEVRFLRHHLISAC